MEQPTVIGKDNAMLAPGDLSHFKQLTNGWPRHHGTKHGTRCHEVSPSAQRTNIVISQPANRLDGQRSEIMPGLANAPATTRIG
jgi:hypothetical protein